MSGYDITPLTSTRFGLGEGPFFDAVSNKLYIVDAFVGNFVAFDTITRSEDVINFSPDVVTFIIQCESDADKFIVSKNNSVSTLKWSTKEDISLGTIENGQGTRFNDAKCDSRGRLWAGTMAGSEPWEPPGNGSLYRIVPTGTDPSSGRLNITIEKQFSPVILSNGLAWTLDDSRMFFVDSIKKVIYKFNYDVQCGSASNSEVFVDFTTLAEAAGVPDGMTMDADGKLWVACYGGSKILRIDPETAQVISTIPMPCPNVTSLTFGGPNLQTIFATSARSDDIKTSIVDTSGTSISGSVFTITPTRENIRGTESRKFKNIL